MITLIIAGSQEQYEKSSYYRHGKYISQLSDMEGYANCRLILLGRYYLKWIPDEASDLFKVCNHQHIRIVRDS